MRTLVATALLAYAGADETSLMQDLVKRSAANKLSASADTKSNGRQDSTSKLLQTAVNMMKNGVTPDVITFVDATNQDINEEVLVAIQSEHDIDQAYINSLCQDFLTAVQALEDHAAVIAEHGSNSLAAQEQHHDCRADEAYACAKSRRCEEQLREKWRVVKHEESVMREIHGHIHDEWCIHPPFFAPIDDWLSHPFNWAQTSPYPLLDLPQDVRDFRHVSVTHFHDYMEQKIVVERAWQEYNEKLEECATLEAAWDEKTPECDQAQNTAREHACEHSSANRHARETFGQEWTRITSLFEQARIAKTANENDRKAEWETLKIVQCLLDHVHSSVITSIETGAPCPTIDSDPDGVTLAIEDCHIVTRGCGEDSMTGHLCLDWCEPPPIPPLPPVEPPACTPAYVAKEQAQFLAAIQATYTAQLTSNSDYPNDLLTAYNTGLSDAGWAGCAPPLVCIDCSGEAPQPPCLEHISGAQQCHLHEEYLGLGQSNFDTFRCLDGACIVQAGRCNGVNNCADGSDENGCDAETTHFVPAYLTRSSTCPEDFHDDVHFRCGNGDCIEKVGLCNGEANCADGSDEAQCAGGIHVTVEATSGRTITVENLQSHTGVFHDRGYNFDSLGDFSGKTFIKYSNDDKAIDHSHVMIKVRTLEPTTVYIVKLDNHGLGWLQSEGYHRTSHTGVSFSGVRETRHKEWDPSLLTTDHFEASAVWAKTVPAGTHSIPGNNGGDGSFLIFVDRPGAEPEGPDFSEVCPGVDTSGDWTDGGGVGVNDIGAACFNALFAHCPVVKYEQGNMAGNPAVYVRHGAAYPRDAYALFTHWWTEYDNHMGSDFNIYTNDADAWAGRNPWTFCNYANHENTGNSDHIGVGFPRDCGPTGYQPHIWMSMGSRGTVRVYTGANCPVHVPEPAEHVGAICSANAPQVSVAQDNSVGGENVAAQTQNAVPFGSGSLPGYCDNTQAGAGVSFGGNGIHCFDNINDGQYGNSQSWIPNQNGGQLFVGIAFDGIRSFSSFSLARDQGGEGHTYADRTGGSYELQYTAVANPTHTTPDAEWCSAGTFTRNTHLRMGFQLSEPVQATGVRLVVSDRAACIDELEVYGHS